jgi:L-rhamnose-H+ transport protein
VLGTIIVLIGGVMEGSFAVPLKYTGRWNWENSWAVYSLVGLIMIPWVIASATVPRLFDVYRSVSAARVFLTLGFGFGWGIANVLFGVAVLMVGMALSFAIVVGMSAALGSLIPLLLVSEHRIDDRSRYLVLGGVALVLCGVVFLGVAGKRRERALSQNVVQSNISRNVTGLSLCLLAGLLAPMLNFSFAFGSEIAANAVKHGASPSNATNAIWALALLGGFISNGGYCILRLTKNNSWSKFQSPDATKLWLLAALMGILWTGGILLYGRGATALGHLGPVVGWPAFQASMIVISSIWGALYGEWRNSDSMTLRFNYAALGALLVAISVLSLGNRP